VPYRLNLNAIYRTKISNSLNSQTWDENWAKYKQFFLLKKHGLKSCHYSIPYMVVTKLLASQKTIQHTQEIYIHNSHSDKQFVNKYQPEANSTGNNLPCKNIGSFEFLNKCLYFSQKLAQWKFFFAKIVSSAHSKHPHRPIHANTSMKKRRRKTITIVGGYCQWTEHGTTLKNYNLNCEYLLWCFQIFLQHLVLYSVHRILE